MLKDMAYKFAQVEIAPISLECDKEEKPDEDVQAGGVEPAGVEHWLHGAGP